MTKSVRPHPPIGYSIWWLLSRLFIW